MSSRRKHFHNHKGKGKHFNSHKGKHFDKPNNPKAPKQYHYKNQLLEEDVGITEYLTVGGGFSGIIKARYSDFQVNEIDLQGNVAKLTDTSCPKEFENSTNNLSYKETEKSPSEYIPQEKWEALRVLAETQSDDPVVLDAANLEKSARKEVHNTIRNYFARALVANTIDKDGENIIEFKKFTKAGRQDLQMKWPDDVGKYVHFLLYKEDMNTMEAITRIASAVKIRIGNFTYAGVKDKRSKSTQWVCVKKVFPKKLLSCTKNLMHFELGNLTFKHAPLKLGQLQGNKFRIALRNITIKDDVINTSMEAVKKTGFINYYGLQRFGNDKEVPTFDIGIKLLLGQWKEAVELILKPKQQDEENSHISKAKVIYQQTGNAKKAVAVLRNKKLIEELLLEGLAKGNSNDYVNALENIPRNMRLMYLHAVQSLIWNKMVSKRIKLFGLEPVVGDLVLEHSDKLNEVLEGNVEEENTNDKDSDDSDLDDDEKDQKPQNTENESEDKEIKCKVKVKALTETDLSNYNIYDVVLPLPGYDIVYPENIKEYYKAALEEYGLTLEMPKQKVKTYTLSGDYRNILVKIQDLTWKTMLYNSPTDNLILSDLEELKGQKEPESIENGQYKALVLEFSLPSSCYATMFLREILKMNTSSSAQAKLNDYHSDKGKKIIINDNVVHDDSMEASDTPLSSSLLTNPDKFEAFKNSIFEDIMGGQKRKNVEEEESSSKIQKID